MTTDLEYERALIRGLILGPLSDKHQKELEALWQKNRQQEMADLAHDLETEARSFEPSRQNFHNE